MHPFVMRALGLGGGGSHRYTERSAHTTCVVAIIVVQSYPTNSYHCKLKRVAFLGCYFVRRLYSRPHHTLYIYVYTRYSVYISIYFLF